MTTPSTITGIGAKTTANQKLPVNRKSRVADECAEHEKRAVRQIDHVHQTEDQRKTCRHQK
jgi:hypothetical protein